jgi:hypothetical protein
LHLLRIVDGGHELSSNLAVVGGCGLL